MKTPNTQKTKITADKFLELWRTEDYELLNRMGVTIKKDVYNNLYRLFENLEVDEDIIIPDIEEYLNKIQISENSIINNLTVAGRVEDIEIKGKAGNLKINGKSAKLTIWKGVIGNIIIEGEAGELLIWKNAGAKNITIKGTVENIIIYGKVDSLNIWENGKVGDINVGGKAGFLEVSGLTKRISVSDKGKIRGVLVQYNGEIGDIRVGSFWDSGIPKIGYIDINGKARDIWVAGWGKTGDISVSHMGSTRDINIKGKVGNFELKGVTRHVELQGSIKDIVINGFVGEIRIEGEMVSLYLRSYELPKLFIGEVAIAGEIQIMNTKVNHIQLQRMHHSDFRLIVNRCQIETIEFNDSTFHNSDIIHIKSSQIKNLCFENVNNLGNIYVSNLKVQESKSLIDQDENSSNSFRVLTSSLGRTEFVNCALEKFNNFQFYNSSFLDCFFAGTSIPKFETVTIPKIIMNTSNRDDQKFNLEWEYELEDFNDDNTYPKYDVVSPQQKGISLPAELMKGIAINDQKRQFYSQVKSVYLRQGDQTSADIFLASEFEAYKLFLQYEMAAEKFIRKYTIPSCKKIDLWQIRKEQFVLFLNRWSSNYGTNWLRAATLTLVITACCFSMYLLGLGYKPGTDSGKFFELSSYSLSYLNPFRDEDTSQLMTLIQNDIQNGYLIREQVNGQPCHYIPPIARFWDYISRIIVAFMVYQTIAAFRRLGKN